MKHEYADRIGKVIAYIEENSSRKLDLDALAGVSNFSKYHFSRIFAVVTGVTPAVYVTRKRLENAVRLLKDTDRTVLDIAHSCGFESLSTFNGVFKRRHGKSPSELRRELQDRNFSLGDRKKREEPSSSHEYDESAGNGNHFLRRIWSMNVTLKELPDLEVAFVRHTGSYLETGRAWETLGSWAGRNGLTPERQQFIGISLDDPSLVDEFACRYDACVTLPPGFEREGHTGVSFKKLEGGSYGRYAFYDTVDKLALAYANLYGNWLPRSGYEADDRYALEFCMNDPFRDPEGKAKVDLYIPVRPKDELIPL
ncbi:AraC family transcriptional regulator [Paenibacillus chitinolyticus]|uniref:AraC family transcriptional regulator n=1 Tax=Paenibacillus chitinolyticus TaxID=79263 RepID=UPI0026E4E108|nr:AraC family transcriptional regulator [Paenibacillus chitinolyticus]GKS13051.1 AraC family transcriptional regulator [Paenibacillus chitinolyticus]